MSLSGFRRKEKHYHSREMSVDGFVADLFEPHRVAETQGPES
jgi:hypothetical protein